VYRSATGLALGLLSALGSCGCARSAVPERALLAPERVVTVGLSPLACGVRVTLHIAPGYHIMSDQPSAPNFIATRVLFESREIELEPAMYPPAVPYTFGARTIATFRGDTAVVARCAASSGAGSRSSAGFASVDVALRYQACTESSCLFPVTLHFSTRIPEQPTKTAEISAP
jgi:hypothetical protein